MPTAHDGWRRLWSWREIWRAPLCWGLVASVWQALLWACLLLLFGLFVGMLIDGGRLDVVLTPEQAEIFQQWTGVPLAIPHPSPAEGTPAASDTSPALQPDLPLVTQHWDDAGLLPTVWRVRDTWWGGGLAWVFRHLSWLHTFTSALITLLVVAGVLWMLRVLAVAGLRRACRLQVTHIALKLRRQLFRQALRLGAEDIDRSGLAEAQRLFRHDVEQLRQRLFTWFEYRLRIPGEVVSLLVVAGSVELLLTAQWVFFMGIGWWILERSGEQMARRRRLAADRADHELQALTQSLAAARLIHGYGLEAQAQQAFQKHAQRWQQHQQQVDHLQDNPWWLHLAAGLLVAGLAGLLLMLLGGKVFVAEISPAGAGVFLAAMLLGLSRVLPIRDLPAVEQELLRHAEHIGRYLDRLPSVSQAIGAKFLPPLSRMLHVERVTYRTPQGKVLLHQVEAQLTAQRMYAVISLDPDEARAFVSLLPRFIEPQEGRVLFDGEDIAWGTLESLRSETVFVSADDPLLPGTVLENIQAGREEITLAQATEAAKLARAHNFITRLPQGYDTPLRGYDDPLDEGQRYRLALARALVRNPSVLILEEPATPLDEETKQLLDDAYTRIAEARTLFFLPRRLSTVRRCDDVLLLHHGRLEVLGPYAILVRESPLFRHWEYINFNDFRQQAQNVT
ncbi:MAG: hypothetical protein KatS3mg114_1230 [Planctomycetaceae bacterium]|nr:MAG: hypothetical protein KatS3mg114_1230 [Planctomycetaceae bacterium]